ncbi:class F sortase [Actinoplanes sp. OR16]|uniref:class F sortase n=1 Tax=Actinoplanes sp. OR16 TaxID=946334 RepID=UPI000F6D78C6|nr:class F sortase [Actinoplanes sp. OR16]BBH70623.1 class F sortase [Actinoplanes sp. OR16]
MSVSSTPRRSPGRALLPLVAGLTLATTAGVAVIRSQPADDFGAPAVTALQSAPAQAPAVPIADGALPTIDTRAPTRLRIPALDLDAAVEAVGIEPSTGDFAVPPSVDRVGWYRYGPGFAADAGSIVIAGHVDSAADGKGAFFRLGALENGDTITLVGAGGQEREFRVVARERYRKTAIPLPEYFARDGATRLTLITCGGPFDARTRHYRDNVVVTATPTI